MLGVKPGSTLEWDVEGDKVVVKRTGKYSLADLHNVLFPDGPPPRKTIEEMDEGIAAYMREKYARR